MHDGVKGESFRQLLGNPKVLVFAQRVLTEGYIECAPGHEQTMWELMEQAFNTLIDARQDKNRFQAAVRSLVEEVFRKGEPDFWFNRIYRNYKREIKPNRRFDNLSPLLVGDRVLDLGCGDGLTSLALHRNGYRVHLTDVLDYRDEMARSLPFVKMTDPKTIPYHDESFDTAIVLAVLHHVETEGLTPILAELYRTSRRVIVEEDCYVVPDGLEGLSGILRRDSQLSTFMTLPVEDQLRYLMFVDYFANAITQGITEMDIPFNFKTVSEWKALFAAQGFAVCRTLLMGFQRGFFNRSCHVWFVLERKG